MSRRDGWWGVAFVAGVLVAAAGVSLPPSTWAPARIAAFYHAHAAAIAITQVIGLLAVGALVMLLRGILRSALRPTPVGAAAVAGSGAAVGVANVLTTAPVLALTVFDPAAAQTWTRLVRLSELSDDVLFAAAALFAAALAYAASLLWLRVLAAVVAALSLVRSAEWLLGSSVFDLVAPTAFLALMLAVSISMLVRSRATPSRQLPD